MQHAALQKWIERLDTLPHTPQASLEGWGHCLTTPLTIEQLVVIERVVGLMTSVHWEEVRQQVRACATTRAFHHHPQMMTAYSRAVRVDAGSAENHYRHLIVANGVREAYPTLSNPDVHLLAELAYQGFAYGPRARRIRSAA